ncbi:Aldo/keto reductase, partial [Violaceomyces palustris]
RFTPMSGQDQTGPIPYDPQEPVASQVLSSFHQSLMNLHPAETAPSSSSEPYIDSYLLHSPLNSLEATLEAWRVLEGLVDRGLVRRIGLSNVYDPQIFKALFSAARIKPSILQNRWHFSTGHDREEGEEEEARGITYQPFWSLTGNPRLLVSPPVQDIAVRRKLTSAQVVYGFIKQGMGIPGLEAAVLCGTTDETHMREAVEVASRAEGTWEEAELEMVRKEVYGE